MEETHKLSFWTKWWISIRPFALPASTMPVVFGTVLAVVYGGYAFNPLYFILAFLGMVILHSGANILSDIYDFRKGLDTVPTPVSGGIVRGIISEKEAKTASVLMLITGTIIGILLTILTGPWLPSLVFLGLSVGLFYSRYTPLAM
jgi:1,4-dihydroxy-2-naphthoate octaprenyltransferase